VADQRKVLAATHLPTPDSQPEGTPLKSSQRQVPGRDLMPHASPAAWWASTSAELALDQSARRRNLHQTIADALYGSSDVPTSWRYAALWVALAGVTLIVAFLPQIPEAVREPRLSAAIGTVSGVIGLSLLQLGILRFKALRRPIDLHAGLGFGVLAVSNLFAVWVNTSADYDVGWFERATYFVILVRAMAAVLFLSGLASSQQYRGGWVWYGSVWLGLGSAVLLGVGAIAILLIGDAPVPELLSESAVRVLATGRPVNDVLAGQYPPLVIANLALAVAFLGAALGYTAQGHRMRDSHIASLAAGLVIFFYAQLHALFFPPLPSDYVSAADAFRLLAYGLLLSSLVWHTAQDFATTASNQERLRLSRELHDGLAQQLAMLRLRLGRVAEVTTRSDSRSHDLEVAQLVLESAAMETRRAIAALRSEGVPWEEFEQALQARAAEFSMTHDVDARVWIDHHDVYIDSQLQADVLRILQEAFSNATRHGNARRIDALVRIHQGMLDLTIQDHGRGFDTSVARHGVGLRSMTERVARRRGSLEIVSGPGQGTRVQANMPLRAARGAL
jgi:signal transduction histidine kinase